MQKTKKTLKFSFLDGIFASCMTGFTQDYLVPFIILLGGSARHVGMLNALPNLFAALVQLKSADLVDKLRSRKRMVCLFVLLQASVLFVISLSAFITQMEPVYFIGLVILFCSFGALVNPAWGSLMSDIVPERKRGAYFGWRSRYLGLITVGATILAGYILHMMKPVNELYGFLALFSAAFVFRLISSFYLGLMHEPLMHKSKEAYFTFIEFIKRLKESNFAKFVLFVAVMNFSVNLAAPYFAVFMLRDLQFSYLRYTMVNIIVTLTIIFMTYRWGRHADKVGNLKIIKATAPLIGCIPLFWIVSQHMVSIVLAQLFSGFVWAGFNLCCSNFIYDAVSPAKRTRCIAYFNLLNGLALCAGALSGGLLLKFLPPLAGYKILMLFLISSAIRIAVGVVMPLFITEVRSIQKVKSHELFFSVVGMKPLLGIERKTSRY